MLTLALLLGFVLSGSVVLPHVDQVFAGADPLSSCTGITANPASIEYKSGGEITVRMTVDSPSDITVHPLQVDLLQGNVKVKSIASSLGISKSGNIQTVSLTFLGDQIDSPDDYQLGVRTTQGDPVTFDHGSQCLTSLKVTNGQAKALPSNCEALGSPTNYTTCEWGANGTNGWSDTLRLSCSNGSVQNPQCFGTDQKKFGSDGISHAYCLPCTSITAQTIPYNQMCGASNPNNPTALCAAGTECVSSRAGTTKCLYVNREYNLSCTQGEQECSQFDPSGRGALSCQASGNGFACLPTQQCKNYAKPTSPGKADSECALFFKKSDGQEHPFAYCVANHCTEDAVLHPTNPNDTSTTAQLCNQVSPADKERCNSCFGDGNAMWTAVGCIPTSYQGITASIIKVGLSVAGGVSLLMILAASFMLTTSQGEPKAATEAKDLLTSAIVGLLFIIFSVTILQFIGVKILQLPGFGS